MYNDTLQIIDKLMSSSGIRSFCKHNCIIHECCIGCMDDRSNCYNKLPCSIFVCDSILNLVFTEEEATIYRMEYENIRIAYSNIGMSITDIAFVPYNDLNNIVIKLNHLSKLNVSNIRKRMKKFKDVGRIFGR